MIKFKREIEASSSNYWLNAIQLKNKESKYELLNAAHKHKIMLRPVWKLSFEMPMYEKCIRDRQTNALELSSTIVNLPSSYRTNE
jgi:perosamine synthetase